MTVAADTTGSTGMTTAPRPPVPFHPECTDDPAEVRWVIPAGTVAMAGDVAAIPGPLADLLADGRIAGVRVEAAAVLIRLDRAERWRSDGAAIRDALASALARPGDWVPRQAVTADAALRAAVQGVLAGPVGDFIRSHGGEVAVASVCDGRVSVRMRGACAHCPAAELTLRLRLEAEIRRRFPQVVEVAAASDRPRRRRPRIAREMPRALPDAN